MANLEDSMKSAVTQAMAAEVLKNITAEHREAILAKSIREALNGYSFTNALESLVAEKAREIAAEMLATSEWRATIYSAVQEGLCRYTEALRPDNAHYDKLVADRPPERRQV